MIERDFEKEDMQVGKDEKGFSLIEMLVAIVVVTVGLVSIVGISAYVSRTNSVSNNLNVLAAAAQDQVDRLRTAVWTSKTEDPMISIGGSIALSQGVHTQSSSPNTSQAYTASTAQPQPYRYTLDPANPHRASATNTAAGDLTILWQVRAGATPDLRCVTIRVVQNNAPANMAEGFVVTTLLNRN